MIRHRTRSCKLNSSLFLLTEILILQWIQTCPGWTFWRRQLIIISINLWSFWKSAEEQTHDSFIFNKALMKSKARRPAARLYKETSLGIVLWRCHCHFRRSFRNTPLWKRRALQHKYRYLIALEKSIVFVPEKPWFIPWPGKILIGLLQLTITWCKIRHAGGQAHYYSRTGTSKQRQVKLHWFRSLCLTEPVRK